MIQSQVRSKVRAIDNKITCQRRDLDPCQYRAQQKSQAQAVALCLIALAPLLCSMIYPPRKAMKISL